MKGLTALLALTIAVSTPAQLATSNTAPVGTVYSFAYSASGNAYSLTDIPIYTVAFNLPFGLDFEAGHAAFYGQRMEGTEFTGSVFGWGAFAQKDIGGDGLFVRATAFMLLGDKRPDFGIAGSLGWKF